MKKIHIFSLVLSFLIGCFFMFIINGFGFIKTEDNSYVNIMWLSIERNSGSSVTYYFVLNSGRELEVTYGIKQNDVGIEYVDYLSNVDKKAHIKLNKNDYNKLIKLANKVEKDGWVRASTNVCDGDITRLFYNHIAYKMVIPDQKDFIELRSEFIKLSPISINPYGMDYLIMHKLHNRFNVPFMDELLK